MERIAKLEVRMDTTNDRLGRVDTRLDRIDGKLETVAVEIATLKERVAHLPLKGFIVSATTVRLALLTAIMLFQSKLQTLLGVAH
ncbi:hypothetical protein [uncultured Methylobacterium sp.]|uniref:hypothetical protein n=1 Tax=uncultured Methylobacterium sp. TaxID=157278 RepID=UPI0035CB5D4E